MGFRKAVFSAVALASLGLGSGMAGASPIVGSISLNGFFDCNCFDAGDTSIVSQLSLIESLAPGLAGGGDGDFAGSGGAVSPINDIRLDGSGLPAAIYTFADGTVFTASAVAGIVRSGMACVDGSCSDALQFRLLGTVTRAGFDATPFDLQWVGQGSCLGAAGVCTSVPTASWAARLVAPAQVSEPASLALLGLCLLGVAARRRRID